jgi:hypothetical protein
MVKKRKLGSVGVSKVNFGLLLGFLGFLFSLASLPNERLAGLEEVLSRELHIRRRPEWRSVSK